MAIASPILIRSTSPFGWRIPASLSLKKREARNTVGRASPDNRTGFRAKRASQGGYAAVMKPPYAKFSFCLIFIFDIITPHVLPLLWGVFPISGVVEARPAECSVKAPSANEFAFLAVH